MKNYFRILFLLFFFYNGLHAQDMQRVRQYLDTLCAPGLHGRGAAFDGQKNAAGYLSNRFREIGLLPISNNYFQNFNYDINTFSGTIFLQTNNTTLVPGKDYIVESASPSGKETFKTILLDTLVFSSKKYQKKFLALDIKKNSTRLR